MASNNKDKKDSVSDTRHNDWTGKQKPTFCTTIDTENLKVQN